MKNRLLSSIVMAVVAFVVCLFPSPGMGQVYEYEIIGGCTTGQCPKVRGVMSAPVEGASYVLRTGAAVTRTAVNSTVAVGERIVDATGNILEATVDGVGNIVYRTAKVVTAPVRAVASGLAEQKSQQQAARQSCCHVGGSFNGARYEGVGFSTYSPEDAIRRCCYSNRSIRESGVAYGYNRQLRAWGWFATIFCD